MPERQMPERQMPDRQMHGRQLPERKSIRIGITCPLTRTAGADLLWNPDGAASCRFATRPPYGSAGPPGRLSLGKNETLISKGRICSRGATM